MLGALYLIGIPVFVFFAWVFSEAVHVREFDDRNSRILVSVLAGALWPVMLVGVAQMLGCGSWPDSAGRADAARER